MFFNVLIDIVAIVVIPALPFLVIHLCIVFRALKADLRNVGRPVEQEFKFAFKLFGEIQPEVRVCSAGSTSSEH